MIEQLDLNINELFQKIIQMTDTGIYWKDAKGKYLGCNYNFLKMSGFENPEQIIGKNEAELWDSSKTVAQLMIKNDQTALEHGYVESKEFRIVSGREKKFSFTRTRLINKRDEVVGIFGTCVEAVEPDDDSGYRDTLLQQIIDTVNASIYWKDMTGRYLGCNKYVVEMAGLHSREELIGKSDMELVWAGVCDKLLAVDTSVIENGRFVGEEKFLTAHGSERVFLTVKDQLIGTNGEVYGLIGTSLEISAQKEAERLRLEMVRQQVLNDESEKFKKEAHQVAHDIRSPLSTILMTLKVSQDLPEPQRVALRDAATRINDIANNLIGRFKQEQENKNISEEQSEPVLLSSALLEILTEKKYQYQNRALMLNHEFGSNANFAWINIKPSALKRMISNVINNAVDAFDGKSGQVLVQLDASDVQVGISIKDNGKGMPAELLQKLREKIPVTFGKGGGHGIGMTQVYDTLDASEGRLEIESAVGLGTHIRLIFPRVSAQHWIADQIDLFDDDTVIVLDDDSSIHSAWDFRFKPLCQIYRQLKVIHHDQGQETLDFFAQLSPEKKKKVFLLSDYELLRQGMNGLDVIAQVDARRSVLVTSYYGHRTIQQEAQKTGTCILPKQLAAEVPIFISRAGPEAEVAQVVSPIRVDAIFVDDEQSLLDSYLYFIGEEYSADAYSDPRVFLDRVGTYSRQTKIFLDQHYTNYQHKGEYIAEQLQEAGYTRLYLLTGDATLMEKTSAQLTVLLKGDLDALAAALEH